MQLYAVFEKEIMTGKKWCNGMKKDITIHLSIAVHNLCLSEASLGSLNIQDDRFDLSVCFELLLFFEIWGYSGLWPQMPRPNNAPGESFFMMHATFQCPRSTGSGSEPSGKCIMRVINHQVSLSILD